MKLKIKKEHQEIIKPYIQSILSAKASEIKEHVKHLRVLKIQGKVKSINTRLCFDILYLTPCRERAKFYEEVYKYANDSNIESFLKSIVKPERLTGEK